LGSHDPSAPPREPSDTREQIGRGLLDSRLSQARSAAASRNVFAHEIALPVRPIVFRSEDSGAGAAPIE
jgi:hypothetical protein